MYKSLCIFVFLITSAATIDKKVFKNCAKVPYCQRLRSNQVPEDSQYRAEIGLRTTRDYTTIIPLKNGKNHTLYLEISLLETAVARIQVKEINSTRFELPHYAALNGIPATVPYYKTNLANISYAIQHHEIADFSVIIVDGPPFRVEIYRNDRLQITLNSERFVMENTKDSKSFAFAVKFETADKLYGLFDHAYDIALPETADGSMDPFRLKNLDSSGYEVNSPMALYGSVPAVYGHSTNATTGIFLHNAAEQWVDISYKSSKPSIYFMVEGADFDLFLLTGPTPKDVVRQFTALTGTADLPPLWSLGYHQSRKTYKSQEEVKNVVTEMVNNQFPMDSIWLDAGYSQNNEWYRWHPTAFSDPIEMQKNISSYNKSCVVLGNPSIRAEKNYSVYTMAKKHYFVLLSNETDYNFKMTNLTYAMADYFWDISSMFYSNQLNYDHFDDSTPTIAGFWNELNEPTTSDDTNERTLPSTALHRLNEDENIKDRDVHNAYGLMQAISTYEGLLLRDKYKVRPFVLSRSHFAGSQKYAAMWTGDNTASWEHFAISFSQCLTGNILGMVFCGADIGGFIGEPSDELLQRWYQGAVWLPFFRSHSSSTTKRREPYLFSNEVQKVIRSAIELRYEHIPYFYTLFYEHFITGDPIIRPLFYQYPGIYGYDTEMLVGENILAVAVVKEGSKSVKVFLPGNEDDIWYKIDKNNIWSYYKAGKTVDIPVDISSSPVFYKAGSIIVRQDDVKLSTKDTIGKPYTVYANLNKDNTASGRFYMDDFTSFDYSKKQKYFYYNLTYKNNTLNFGKINGDSLNFDFKLSKILVHYPSEKDSQEVCEKIYVTTNDGQKLENSSLKGKSEVVMEF